MKYNVIMNAIQKVVTTMRYDSLASPKTYVHTDIDKYLNDGWRVVQISTCDSPSKAPDNTHRFFTTYLLEKLEE